MVIGTANRPARGETVSGDQLVVVEGEQTLIAIADGLGHGPQAEIAATAYCDVVSANPEMALDALMNKLTREISGTRGVAGALVRIDETNQKMHFCGIGNIEFRSLSTGSIRPICIPGIVGQRLRKIKVFEYEISPRDLYLLHTDGISTRFTLEDLADLEVQNLADEMLKRHGKHHDDATCIAIRLDE